MRGAPLVSFYFAQYTAAVLRDAMHDYLKNSPMFTHSVYTDFPHRLGYLYAINRLVTDVYLVIIVTSFCK